MVLRGRIRTTVGEAGRPGGPGPNFSIATRGSAASAHSTIPTSERYFPMPKNDSKSEAAMPPRSLADAIDYSIVIGRDAKKLSDFLTQHIAEITANSDHRRRAAVTRVQSVLHDFHLAMKHAEFCSDRDELTKFLGASHPYRRRRGQTASAAYK